VSTGQRIGREKDKLALMAHSTRISVAVLFVAFLLVQKNRAGFTLPGQLFLLLVGS
jgi:hypothetical protein